MKRFDCLDRSLDIHSHTLLEASAGTGKTFSIENLYVRLLIEEPVCAAQEVLVVTFTKAAVKELRSRIRNKIAASLKIIKENNSENAPDYLRAILEKDGVGIRMAKRRLETALTDFDLSKIFTIHAFCEMTLRDHQFLLDGESQTINELIDPTEIRKAVRDFFRTELTREAYSPEQIAKVKSAFKQDMFQLETAIEKDLSSGVPIEQRANFSDLFFKFREIMKKLSRKYTSEQLFHEFEIRAPYYNKINEECKIKVGSFCRLFDKGEVDENDFEMLIKDGLLFEERLDPSNAHKKKKCPYENPPSFPELKSLVDEARSPNVILSRLIHDCSRLLQSVLDREDKYRFDDLLTLMLKRCRGSDFAEKVRGEYKAVIIDEFQDTDPVQWDIFRQLFLHDPKRRSHVYLVGDPKQSIYAFRQADIYTYLSAAKEIGDENVGSLEVNYRSSPAVIDALNALFSEENAPGLISLPREKTALTYRPVEAGPESTRMSFSDNKGAVHFMIAEGKKGHSKNWPSNALQEERFFPALTNEMIRLKKDRGIPYSEWAVLVRTRKQGELFAAHCLQQGVPVKLQKERSLFKSEAYIGMKQLLTALTNPKDMSALKVALAEPIIGFDLDRIKSLDDDETLTSVLEAMAGLYRTALDEGFASFYHRFLRTRFLNGETVKERLVAVSEELFHDFEQIAEILIDAEYKTNGSLMQCLDYLSRFENLEANNDDTIKCRQNPEGDAAQILTMHVSKGLEFGIVAAIGLMVRSTQKDKLIPVFTEEGRILVPADKGRAEEEHLVELDAEKMRQFYVAMTRAKHRVYVPVAVEEGGKQIPLGIASPMELFLARFRKDGGDPFQPLADIDADLLAEWAGNTANVSCERLPEKVFPERAPIEKTQVEIVPPKRLALEFPRETIRSFSSIAKPAVSSEPHAPHDFHGDVKTVHTLPSGREIGTILHKILENISFETVRKGDDILPYIASYTQGTPYEEWDGVIKSLVENALKTPLTIGGSSFSLCEIPPEAFFREIEFLYSGSDSFYKGVIDFVFEHGGKYYILDWKSNWLGPSDEDYGLDNLEKSMKDHDYSLQAKIYREALERYTSLFDDRPFGGAYYFYLRGIQNDKTHGVYEILW